MRLRRWLSLAPLLLTAACGAGDNGANSRFIEVSYYVTGGKGDQFEIASGTDPCNGFAGIQSPNTDHQFGGRIFQAPYLIVLENAKQPIRAAIRNLSSDPLNVNLFLGMQARITGSEGTIQPGECRIIESASTIDADGKSRFTPAPKGPKTQIEVCSPTESLGTSCLDSASGEDRQYFYFAALGDIEATNLSNCALTGVLDACQSPSTFFIENPQEQVSVAMKINPGQHPQGMDSPQLRVELYINDEPVLSGTNPVDTDVGGDAIVSKNL